MRTVFGFPRNVFVLGVVSLFMDISSEMIYPLIPIFLSEVLHASKTSIGFIEGVAESTASLLKVVSGWLSDRLGRRKALILWGYGISVFSRPLLATAPSWIQVLIYRFADRMGKGVRTAPRDAIIADSSPRSVLGRSFGFHRSMDTVGAVIGPIVAFALLSLFAQDMRLVFWVSMVPGAFALFTIILFVEETRRKPAELRTGVVLRRLDRRFKRFLIVAVVFTLGKTSEAFLILRAQEIGMSVKHIPLLYLTFNMVTALLSTPAGMMADSFGMRKTILASYFLFALIFLGFAHATATAHVWLLFIAFGLFVAINEGVQRAYVATVIQPEVKATGYGIYHTFVGLAALPSSTIGGALWQSYGSRALFYYGAALSFLACILLIALVFPKDGKG